MGEVSLPLSEHPAERLGQRAMSLLPDDRLARLAAEGNTAAFAAIYRRHHQALYRYCRSILHNGEEAKDALQNTMVSALRALPGEQRKISLKPWLFRVAHNEAISVLRRRSPDAPIDFASTVASQRDAPAEREKMQALIADLAALPERQRSALVMRELNGLSHTEIGGALGTSEAAAKQLVYEARTALHELEEGREMGCDTARATISARDGRKLRSRKLRAHVRSCQGCRSFETSIAEREAGLAAIAPPLPAPAAAALLEAILGGGGGTGGGGLAGLAAGAAGESLGGSAATKAASVAVAASLGVAGAGVVVGADDLVPGSGLDRKQVAAAPENRESKGSGSGTEASGGKQEQGTKPGEADGSGGTNAGAHDGNGGGGSNGAPGSSATAPASHEGGQSSGGGSGVLGTGVLNEGIPGSGGEGGTGGVVDDVDQAVEGTTGTNPGLGEATGPVTGPVDDVVEGNLPGNLPDVGGNVPDLGLPGGNQVP
jgi:RNA polymerase sigma factor (sigma-70 family)